LKSTTSQIDHDLLWQNYLKSDDAKSLSTYDIWAKKRREFFKEHGNLPTNENQNRALRSFKDKYKGQRIFIIGNGPSLNKINFEQLKGEFTFGVNRINLLYDRTDWRPTFFTVNDWEVGPDNAAEISTHTKSHIFIPKRFEGMPHTEGSTIYSSINALQEDDFSWDATKGLVMGGTVLTLPIQLAAYMGFNPIYLIGVDVSYQVKSEVVQSGKVIADNQVKQFLESTADDDPNHFDPRYFGKGKKWHNPNPDKMKDGFSNMWRNLSKKNISLLNATIGGQLDSIPRVEFDSLFSLSDLKDSQTSYANHPELCIVIPAYNAGSYISNCIDSILDQIPLSAKVVIVNDGSTDNTLEIIESYDSNQIIVVNQTNGGRSAARNLGLDTAFDLQPKYIAFQDADDYYTPNCIPTLLSCLESDLSLNVVSGTTTRISASGENIRTKDVQRRDLTPTNFLTGPPVMLQSSIFRNIKEFSEIRFDPVPAGEDWLYLARVSTQVGKWSEIDIVSAAYRATDQAILKTTHRYAVNMLSTYLVVKHLLMAHEEIPQNKLSNSDTEQVTKMSSRLFACGQPEFGRALLESNPIGLTFKELSRDAIQERSRVWMSHLGITVPELMERLYSPVLEELYEVSD